MDAPADVIPVTAGGRDYLVPAAMVADLVAQLPPVPAAHP